MLLGFFLPVDTLNYFLSQKFYAIYKDQITKSKADEATNCKVESKAMDKLPKIFL